MLDQLFRALVVIPFYAVPIALISWAVFQIVVRRAAIKAFIGLVVGATLCFVAFLLFLMNTYCENCADRPVSAREAVAVIAYVIFGVVMLVALWLTAVPRRGAEPTQVQKNVD
ncbi:MAG TPA: hypothetical protein VED01_15970 [Burkholderiales bacterium]|nr:hypothetical protein [Burkholderiales bacterium]